eukprot:TRINITY_DN4774_c0_g1_i1.p1 TRINITY_DN4774_c0_g1~~TRINITY_DN4774_c0_g1_i1.p1  ORF type:complete len:118 (+),score=14.59 TRINITY_DN4774_c0_g1_i1:35-355(+)
MADLASTAGQTQTTDAQAMSATQSSGDRYDLPDRFHHNTRQWRSRKQHPMYQTSNNLYGGKVPSVADLPLKFFGTRGEFTKKFTKMPMPSGLNTGMPNHRVHDHLQ